MSKYIQCDSCLGAGGFVPIDPPREGLVELCGKCHGYGTVLWIDEMLPNSISPTRSESRVVGYISGDMLPKKRDDNV